MVWNPSNAGESGGPAASGSFSSAPASSDEVIER